MIHLAHTPVYLPRVARAIRLPLPAVMTPLGPPIRLANEHIPRVELLKPGAIGVVVRQGVAHVRLLVLVVGPRKGGRGAATRAALQGAGAAGGGVQRHVAWGGLDDVEGAEVAGEGEEEEEEVEGEEGGGGARLMALAEEVVDCRKLAHKQRMGRNGRNGGIGRTADARDDDVGRVGEQQHQEDGHEARHPPRARAGASLGGQSPPRASRRPGSGREGL